MVDPRFYSSTALETQLTSSMSPSSTVINLAATTGFPPSTPFTLAIDYAAPNEELVEVTAISGLTLTVTRAFDGTSATAHNPGAAVRHVSSAIDFTEAKQHELATMGVHGLADVDVVVGEDATQTLHNKTLDHATGTLDNINIFTTGTWTTSVIGDDATTGMKVFDVLENPTDLTEVFSVSQSGFTEIIDNDSTAGRIQFYIASDSADDANYAMTVGSEDGSVQSFAVSQKGRINQHSDGAQSFWTWRNEDGSVLYGSVAGDGRILANKGLSVNGGQAANFIVLDVHGVTGQTSQLFRITDPTQATTYVSVAANGVLTANAGVSTNTLSVTNTATVGKLVELNPAGWISYTPTVTDATSGTLIPSTGATGWYQVIGKTIHVNGSISPTTLSTGGSSVDLPIAGLRRELGCGIMSNTGSGVSTSQSFLARMPANQQKLVLTSINNAFLNAPAGSTIYWSCFYEVA